MSSKDKSASHKASPSSEVPAKKSKKGEEQTSRGLSVDEWRSAMSGEGAAVSSAVPAEASAGAVQILSAMSVTVTVQAMLNVFAQQIKDAIEKLETRVERIEEKVARLPTMEAELRIANERLEELHTSTEELKDSAKDGSQEGEKSLEPVVVPPTSSASESCEPKERSHSPVGRRSNSPGPSSKMTRPIAKRKRFSPVRGSREVNIRNSGVECKFCHASGHTTDDCLKVRSGRARREFALKQGMCFGCGSKRCERFACKPVCSYCEKVANEKIEIDTVKRMEQLVPHGSAFCTIPSAARF